MEKFHLTSKLSPGDAVVMTVAIKSLHDIYPGEYETSVETSAMEVWENNPHIVPLSETSKHKELHYALINQSNQRANSFMQAYADGLSKVIQRPLQITVNKPQLYLTEEEKSWMDQIQQYKT